MESERNNQAIQRRDLLRTTSYVLTSVPLVSHTASADSHQTRIDNPGKINWNITHPDDTDNRFYSICDTTETDEYVLVGWSDDIEGSSVLIYRINNSGSVIWKKEINYNQPENDISGRIYDVIHDGNGIFYAAGSTMDSNETFNDGLVIKFDSKGGIKWNNTYSANNGGFTTIEHKNNDEILVAGGQESEEVLSNEPVCWLMNINSSGDILVDKRYDEGSQCRSISYSTNGIALATINDQDRQGALIKTTQDGTYEYARQFEDTAPKSVLWGSDGHLHLCGKTNRGPSGENLAFLSFNEAGSTKYSKLMDYDSDATLAFDSLIETEDGFVTVGWFDDPGTFSSNQQGWILEYNQNGTVSSKVVGGSEEDWINGFIKIGDNNYITVGSTNSFGETSDNNAWAASVSTNKGISPGDSGESSNKDTPSDSGDIEAEVGFPSSLNIGIVLGIATFLFVMLLGALSAGNSDDSNISSRTTNKDKASKDDKKINEYGEIEEK